MRTRVLLTVDTEFKWGQYRRGGGWEEVLQRSYDPAGVGVPYQLGVLADHKLKACFFVDPMPALVFGPDPVRRMVEPILAAGQEVQLHIHPMWAAVAQGHEPDRFELTNYDEAEQRALIDQARDLLVQAGAPDPVAFRSGSYAADVRTLRALASLGIRYDSSHNGGHHPIPSDLPIDPREIAPVAVEGVIEVPVTVVEDRPGHIRNLQLTAVSIGELGAALHHAAAKWHPIVNIVSHSFELATRDGLRPNRMLCRRFERLAQFLAGHRETLPTAHFSDLADLALDAPAQPLKARRLRTAGRMAEQLWSNLVYERRL